MANVRKAKASEEPIVEAVTEPIEEPAPKKEEAQKQASFFVYLGPTITGLIQNASIWEGTREDVEQRLADAIGKYPRIKVLLIPAERIVQDRDAVTRPGSRLNAEYRHLVRELKK